MTKARRVKIKRSAALPNIDVEPSSFRDPSGFVFRRNGTLLRQINPEYKDHFDRLVGSGLCQELTDTGLLIPHTEVTLNQRCTDRAYKVIKPVPIGFVSYPYEWAFSQLKDAALVTLEIQKSALAHGMTLKDCSAYNIQFHGGRPIFIDTLSFELYPEGAPWVGYRQFCQHFLAPLALMSYVDVRLGNLLQVHLDGIPLDLASSLLPFQTRFKWGLLTHIHLHAKAQARFSRRTENVPKSRVSLAGMLGLIDNLESTIQRLKWRPQGTEWGDYYEDTNYTSDAVQHKKELIGEFLGQVNASVVWDLGANTGEFSRIASDQGMFTIAYDIDPAAVEKNYLEARVRKETHLLPLLLDLTNPSPGIGWENRERGPFLGREHADVVMALALIHHLAISNNAPLDRIAKLFGRMADLLIIEFVPKSDSQVRRLLTTRKDIFPDYRQEVFESEFSRFFDIVRSEQIRNSERTLYLLKRRQHD